MPYVTYITVDVLGNKVSDILHCALVVDKLPRRRIVTGRFVDSRWVHPKHRGDIVYITIQVTTTQTRWQRPVAYIHRTG